MGEGVQASKHRKLNNLEKQGLIQSFEFTHELAWKVMLDFFFYQGNTEIRGSRDATREAFKQGLIEDGERWMEMIKNRNLTSHTYNEKVANKIQANVIEYFHPIFVTFQETMQNIAQKE